ncbi:hypothetical protein N9917_00295 [Deltaproteobacteria bacterium]|nr:hypothetical protein [Deltaproteobacteria bacterium]
MTPLEVIEEMAPEPGEAIALAVVHPVDEPHRFMVMPLGSGPADADPDDMGEFAEDALLDNILHARMHGMMPGVWRIYIVTQEWAASHLTDPGKAGWDLLNNVEPIGCTCGCCSGSDTVPLSTAAARGSVMAEA